MRAIGICWTWNCFQINISFYSKRAAQSENFRMKSQVLVDLVSEKEIISSHFNEFWLWQFKIAGHGQNTRGVISKQHSIQYEFHFHAIASIDTFEIHSIGYWMAAQVQEYKFSFDRVKRFQKPIRFDWIARKAEYGWIFLMKGVLQPLGPLCQNISSTTIHYGAFGTKSLTTNLPIYLKRCSVSKNEMNGFPKENQMWQRKLLRCAEALTNE